MASSSSVTGDFRDGFNYAAADAGLAAAGWQVVRRLGSAATTDSAPAAEGSHALRLRNYGPGTVHILRRWPQARRGRVALRFYDPGPDDDRLDTFCGVQLTGGAATLTVAVGARCHILPDTYHLRIGRAATTASDLDSHVPRRAGWRLFELFVTEQGSYAAIDGVSLAYLPIVEMDSAESIHGFNPAMTAFNQIFIANQRPFSHNAVWDDVVVDEPAFIADAPDDAAIENHYLALYNAQYDGQLLTLAPDLVYDRLAAAVGSANAARTLANHALVQAVQIRRGTAVVGGDSAESPLAARLIALLAARSDPAWAGSDGAWSTNPRHNQLNTAYLLALAAWLLWDQLTADTQARVAAFVQATADRVAADLCGGPRDLTPGATPWVNDTQAEVMVWKAAIAALARHMFPAADPPVAGSPCAGVLADDNDHVWHAVERLFARHTFTVPGADGREHALGFRSATLYPDFRLDNHNYSPHPTYAVATIGGLAKAALPALKRSGARCGEGDHVCVEDAVRARINAVWNVHAAHFDPATMLLRPGPDSALRPFGGKDDWGVDLASLNHALAFLAQPEFDCVSAADYRRWLLHEYRIRHHFLAFPPVAATYGSGPLAPRHADSAWLLNSVVAARHAMALLIIDRSVTLAPVA